MKIPTGFRRLQIGEKSKQGDRMLRESGNHEELWFVNVGKTVARGGFGDNGVCVLRKIDSPWISVKERSPLKEDLDDRGMILCRDALGNVKNAQPNSSVWHDAVYWMPDTKPVPYNPPTPPITFQEGNRTHELFFNKDGSIKAGCVTIDKEKMKEIIARWKEEQE